jgi:ABC-type phosphate/phosphonate transport system substrate-binding protein
MILKKRRPAVIGIVFCLFLLVRGAPAECVENPFGQRGLMFGYSSNLFSELTREDAETALALWSRELARVAGYTVTTKLVVFDDLNQFVAAIRNGQVDFIALTSLDYLKIQGQVPMEPALFGERGGKPGEEQLLLVREDSGVRRLEQLRGRKLTMLRGGSGDIAQLWLDSLLAKREQPPGERFFGGTRKSLKAQQVILPVFFRQADACVVGMNAFRTAVELNPQIGKELKVLATSPVYPIAVTCFRTTLSREQKDEFVRMSFSMVDTVSGKQILTLFRVDKVVRSSDTVMDPLVSLLKERGHPKTASKGPSE